MQKCQRVTTPNQNFEVSQIITETQITVEKIKKNYHTAATIASAAAYTINEMEAEMNELSEQLKRLLTLRQGGTLKVLSFAGKEIKS